MKSCFTYHPARVPVGRRLEYTKSNQDGTNPLSIYVYLTAPEHVSVVKIRAGLVDAPLVLATLDYKLFSATSLHSFWLFRDGSRTEQARFERRGAQLAVTRYFVDGSPPQSMEFPAPRPPFHLYNFDLISFCLMLPHLSEARHNFSVELLDLNPANTGRMDCSYVGTEQRAVGECYRYEVGGTALGGEKGTLWIDPQSGLMRGFEHPVPDNPDWNDLRIVLEESREMTREGWESWLEEELQTKLVDPNGHGGSPNVQD